MKKTQKNESILWNVSLFVTQLCSFCYKIKNNLLGKFENKNVHTNGLNLLRNAKKTTTTK